MSGKLQIHKPCVLVSVQRQQCPGQGYGNPTSSSHSASTVSPTPAGLRGTPLWSCDKWGWAWGGICPTTGVAPGGAKFLCHPHCCHFCLNCSLQKGWRGWGKCCADVGVMLLLWALLGSLASLCHHASLRFNLPLLYLWKTCSASRLLGQGPSFASLWGIFCISLPGEVKGICYLAIFHTTHN